MFKFATNKFTSQGGSGASGSASASGSGGTSKAHHSLVSSLLDSSDNAASKRRQLQKDLFAYNKIADKGFPSKPSAMDYDRKLRLLAIGTKNGDIRIYGAPGTQQQQLSCYHDIHPFPILRMLFVQGQHQLITLSERVYRNDLTNKGESNLYLVLWQIPNTQSTNSNNLVEKVKEYQLEPKIVNGNRLSALTLLNDNSHLFLGFETGDVYVFNVGSFQMVPGVINKDYIIKNIPDQQLASGTSTGSMKRLTQLGAVESICHHPRQLTKLLIAYQRGLWIIFDFIKNQIDLINQTSQQLESAVFYQHGECVATCHSDGSFILWDLEANAATASSTPSSTPVVNSTSNSAPNIVYGPYPCKPVSKCLVKTCRNEQPFVIFSGGCPRVNYSDKITISVIQGESAHVCFDFTSKIIDFFTIDKPSVEKQQQQQQQQQQSSSSSTLTYDNPQALFVLLEEEFVAVDLLSEGWPQYKLPYLCSVHSSAIICTHYVNGITRKFYDALKHYGELNQDPSEVYSERDWPIGLANSSGLSSTIASAAASTNTERKDLLLTGHEDGSVRFWDVTNMSMTLIYRLRTSEYFQTDSTPLDDDLNADGQKGGDDDNWPPFRKVGTFDPYSDDPKLGIQKIYLCPIRETLVVAGTAGQVLIMQLNEQSIEMPYTSISSHKINIIGVSPEVESHFVWKGHEPLATRGQFNGQLSNPNGVLKLQSGYQLQKLIQLYPPATVSALTLNTDWQLIGMGTSHGFALYDYFHLRDLLIRCTLDPLLLLQASQEAAGNGTGGTTISRRKSLKKSLRESFRKLRRGRSQKPNNNKSKQQQANAAGLNDEIKVNRLDEDEMNADHNHRPIERQVESREFKPVDDIPPSVIRYMYFVRTFITSNHQQTNSLWVGTNTGIIYIYALQFLLNGTHMQQQQQQLQPQQQQQLISHATHSNTIRTNQSINCLLAKEMRLKHRAPVVHIQVIDQFMRPLPLDASLSNTLGGVEQATHAQHAASNEPSSYSHQQVQNHKVIICSEEQFKVFQLPTLKPVCKFKLTAVEGARVRRIGYTTYTSKSDPKYSEHCLSCLSNLGDLSVYSLPSLKRQVQVQCMKQQDINAITSFVFSKQGQAFYLQSPSEFVHISMSARDAPHLFMATVAASAHTSSAHQQATSTDESAIASSSASLHTSRASNKKSSNANATSPPVTVVSRQQQQQQQPQSSQQPQVQPQQKQQATLKPTTSSPTSQPLQALANKADKVDKTQQQESSKEQEKNPTEAPASSKQQAIKEEMSSPRSPPPPVPAPRSTFTKDENK
jgi:lethal(2) giant larvae protein